MVANVHHIIVGTCVTYTLLYMCDRPFGALYGDEMCLRTYKPYYSHLCLFTVGYFVYDMIMQLFFYKDFSALGVQNIGHHLVAFVCFGSCLCGGYNFCMFSHVTMVCEVSQFFNNVRGLIGKKESGVFANLNNLIFFITFTILRILLFPVLIFNFLRHTYANMDLLNSGLFRTLVDDPRISQITPARTQFCWLAIMACSVAMMTLNLYWYKIIVGKVYRTILGVKREGDDGMASED